MPILISPFFLVQGKFCQMPICLLVAFISFQVLEDEKVNTTPAEFPYHKKCVSTNNKISEEDFLSKWGRGVAQGSLENTGKRNKKPLVYDFFVQSFFSTSVVFYVLDY